MTNNQVRSAYHSSTTSIFLKIVILRRVHNFTCYFGYIIHILIHLIFLNISVSLCISTYSCIEDSKEKLNVIL